MKKRGQLHSGIIMTFIIAISIILVLILGTRWINSISKSGCKTELIQFKGQLQASVDKIAFQEGSAAEKNIRSPCNFEKMIIVDSKKNVLFESLDNYQLIKENIKKNQDKNLFMIKNGRVEQMDSIKNLDLKIPYFLCVKTKKAILNTTFQGRESGTNIELGDDIIDCTFDYALPIELDPKDLALLLNQILKENQQIKNLVDPVEVNLTRQISYKDGITNITVRKNNLTSFDYYESIPKCILEDLKQGIADGTINITGQQNISDDPLVMWHFAENQLEKSYQVRKLIRPSCLRGLSPGLIGAAFKNITFAEEMNKSGISFAQLNTTENKVAALQPEEITVNLINNITGITNPTILAIMRNHYATERMREIRNIPTMETIRYEYTITAEQQAGDDLTRLMPLFQRTIFTQLSIQNASTVWNNISTLVSEQQYDDAINLVNSTLNQLTAANQTAEDLLDVLRTLDGISQQTVPLVSGSQVISALPIIGLIGIKQGQEEREYEHLLDLRRYSGVSAGGSNVHFSIYRQNMQDKVSCELEDDYYLSCEVKNNEDTSQKRVQIKADYRNSSTIATLHISVKQVTSGGNKLTVTCDGGTPINNCGEGSPYCLGSAVTQVQGCQMLDH